jgi:2-furoyl-CoA dehydrogenase large subunit
MDTARDAGRSRRPNYASRFGPAVCGAVQIAAERIQAKLARAAAAPLNVQAR